MSLSSLRSLFQFKRAFRDDHDGTCRETHWQIMCSNENKVLLCIPALRSKSTRSYKEMHGAEDMAAEREMEHDSTVKHPTLVSPRIPQLSAHTAVTERKTH